MNRGYVRLWRKSLDAGWIRNHKLWAFWTYCLMKASHKEFDAIVGLQVVHLMPGQFVFGRKKAAKETGLTEQEIRTIIESLKKAGNLTIKTTNKYSVITIMNWTIYQGEIGENNRQINQPLTNKEPHTNTRTQNKNIYSQNALQVLAYLNEKTEKRFRDTSSIEARLKDGGTVDNCMKIIDNKLKDPFFIETPKHLNPVTLFRKSHWDTYLNEAVEVPKSKWKE